MNSPVVTTKVSLPSFGRAGVCPEIPVDLYRARLSNAIQRLHAERIDTLRVPPYALALDTVLTKA